MKKILSVLLVLALVAGTAFAAAPTFSGTFSYGYKFGFDGSIEGGSYLGDGDGNGAALLYLKTSTDYADIDFRFVNDDDSIIRGDLGATATVKFDKMISDLFEFEMPVTLNLLVGNQAFSAKDTYAYADPASEDDEIAMDNKRVFVPVGVSVGYKDYITVNAYANFVDKVASSDAAGNDKMILVEALSQPVDGVKLQLAYLFGKSESADDPGDIQAAALVDIATLANLDFSLDVSGFYKGYTKNAKDFSLAKAAVTGGYENFSAYVEYVFSTTENAKFYEDGAKGSSIYTGASYDFQTKVPFSLGTGLSFTSLDVDAACGGTLTASTTLGGMDFQARLGISDFTNIKSGYFRLASLITF